MGYSMPKPDLLILTEFQPVYGYFTPRDLL